jgi:hypothetical protein
MITQIKKKTDLNPNNFIDIETGEILGSKRIHISILEETPMSLVSSKHYFTIDINALVEIFPHLSYSEMGRITYMSTMLNRNDNCICDTDGTPHVDKTLAPVLQLTRQRYKEFMTKLKTLSIIGSFNVETDGIKYTHYCLNPTIGRKGKVFRTSLFANFKDYSK